MNAYRIYAAEDGLPLDLIQTIEEVRIPLADGRAIVLDTDALVCVEAAPGVLKIHERFKDMQAFADSGRYVRTPGAR